MLSNEIFTTVINNEDFGFFGDAWSKVKGWFGGNKNKDTGTAQSTDSQTIINPKSLTSAVRSGGSGVRTISAPVSPAISSKPKNISTHVSSKPKPIIATSPAGKRVAVSTTMTI